MIVTLRQTAAPTARAVSWTPLLAVGCVLGVLAMVFSAWDTTSPTVLGLGAGAMAATLVLAWRDPAASLLAALPVSLFTRRLVRLVLTATVAVPLWLLVTLVLPGDGSALGPFLALSCAGLGVATWLPADRDVTVAAVVPLLWATLAELFGEVSGIVGAAAGLPVTHAAPVAFGGLVLLLLGRHR